MLFLCNKITGHSSEGRATGLYPACHRFEPGFPYSERKSISVAWYPGLKWIGAHPAYCGSSGGMVSMQGNVLRPGSIPDPPITHVFVAVVHGCN